MSVSIRIRRDSSQAWEQNDPVLFSGELGLDLTAKKIKCGDGFNEWTKLPYLNENEIDALRGEYGNETDFTIHFELSKS
jgi:hypothetical protein